MIFHKTVICREFLGSLLDRPKNEFVAAKARERCCAPIFPHHLMEQGLAAQAITSRENKFAAIPVNQLAEISGPVSRPLLDTCDTF